MISFLTYRQYIEIKIIFIKSLKNKSSIKHMKYILNDRNYYPSSHISIFIMVSLKDKEKLLKANIWRVSQFETMTMI